MSLNNERVREGIINKLKEYDAYIDNELPDYIMVMLANKKTVHQINNDLQLFLGENTNRFTVWLQGMLTHTTRDDLSEEEEEEDGGEIEEEREKASPPKPSIGTKRKRSEEQRSSAEVEERSSPPKIIKTTADEYNAGSVRTQRVKVEISPEEGQRSGGGSVRKHKLPDSSRDRDLRELIARRRKEKKTHTPHPKTEMVLTTDMEEESQEGGGMASVVKLVERPRHSNKGGSRLLQRAIQGIGETMSRKETTTKRKQMRSHKAREETARVPLTTSAVPIKSPREKDQESSSDEEVEGNFVDEFREEQREQEVDHKRQEVKAPAVAMVKVPPTVVAMVKTPVVATVKASPVEVDLREYLNKSKERTDANTRFVVTLDGLGDKYRNVDTSQDLEGAGVKGRQGEGGGMEEEEEEELETGNGRTGGLPERCRFWPNCKNGDSCPFHHPSAPCRLFPKCKYGNKCCFIHPQCKFDARCTRADCPYLHTAPRRLGFSKPQAAPVAPIVYTQNIKPVSSYSYRSRRGASWNPGRSPKFPNKSALTWTPTKSQHISQRQFAVSEDQTTPLPV